MAKKKQAGGRKAGAAKKAALQMKGSKEWKAWLDDLGKFLRMPTSTIVDHALIRYAKEMGFDKPPPER